MTSSSHSSAEAAGEPIAAGSFQFIPVQAPGEANDQTTRRLARSHAVKRALENKRKRQQASKENFRVTTSRDQSARVISKKSCIRTPTASPYSLSAGALDPFDTLAVDSSRLQMLLGDRRARLAPEPVFSVAEELAFQSFRSVFRTGFADPALLNAAMLSFASATTTRTEGNVDRECLGYQGQAIGYIRRRMSFPDEATSESTIGAILLLAGVEARLGMTFQVQLHMGAVQLLLEICRTKGVYLSGGIKRAIFWQDLNSSILAGSRRIVDHTTFAELHWRRDPFSPAFFRLPSGFQTRHHLLPKEFIEVLEDVHALQCMRDLPTFRRGDVAGMVNVNNQTASIQSRLAGLPKASRVLECCRLATYLCSVMLCCTVWCALAIPFHVSSQLLRALQQANDDAVWDDHPELLLWLLHIGGAFAPAGTVRSEYVALLRSNHAARFRGLCSSWPEVLGILRQFIWSKHAFAPQAQAFWEETLT